MNYSFNKFHFCSKAFICLCVGDAAQRLHDVTVSRLREPGEPTMLPPALSDPLVTNQQQEWWTAAYAMYNNTAR